MKTASTEINIDRISRDLSQIATDMNTMKALFGDAIINGKIDYKLAAIEVLASRAGALADRSIKAMGGLEVRGNLYDWLED